MGPLPSKIAGHTALFGSRPLHGQEDLWKTTRRSYGRFDREFGYLGMLMNTTLQEAVHLERKYAKNHVWDSLGQLFEDIKSLICELSEILGPRTPEIVGFKIIEFEDTTWRSISLLCERVYHVTTVKVYVQYFVCAR